MKIVPLPKGGVYRAGRWDDIEEFPRAVPAINYAVSAPVHDGPRWEDFNARFATVKCSPSAEAAIGRIISRYRLRDIPPTARVVQLVEEELQAEDPAYEPAESLERGSGVLAIMKRYFISPTPNDPELEDEPELVVQEIPHAVLDDLYLLRIPYVEGVSFVDLDHRDTHETLKLLFGDRLGRLDMKTIDNESLARERDRRLTRLILGTIHDYCEHVYDGQIAGIKLGAQSGEPWESFIYWSHPPFLDLAAEDVELRWVAPWDDDLIEAAKRLDLRVPGE